MRSLRRSIAVLCLLSLLQLLLGSVAPCNMTSDGASRAAMSGAAMTAMNHHATRVDAGTSGDDGCGLPGSAGQCTAMTSCVSTVAPPASFVALAVAPHRALMLPEPARITSSAALAPELPPPRA